jgi:hypothetical protein
MTATTTTALVPIQPAFSDAERLARAGFLAGYRGLTREAYALDLRQFTTWCRAHALNLFAVRRADIEGFARDLEARGRARATVTRRLCAIAGSTSTPSKKSSWNTPRQPMCAGRAWITNLMPLPGTKIHLGHAHRGKVVTVIIEDSQFRILHDGNQLSAHPRTVIKEVTRRSASGHANYEI